jgi:signal transduction histidine kinase
MSERSRLEAAVQLGRRSLIGAPLEELVRDSLPVIADQVGAEFSVLVELLPDGSEKLLGESGWKADFAAAGCLEVLKEGEIFAQAVRSLEPVSFGLLDQTLEGETGELAQHGIRSYALVPILGRSRPMGMLGVFRSALQPLASEDIAWLQVVGNIFSFRFEQNWQAQWEHDRQLLRAEQMMAIGQVAAGVAHELRNPLTSIKGLVQVNIRDLLARGLPAEDLAIVEHEIRRMERTLQIFLDFARPSRPDRRKIELAAIIDRVAALVSGRAKKQHVEVRLLRPSESVDVVADGDQIQQLVLNLVLNALDAMPHGGTIEIDLRPPRDGYVELYVRDDGPGIAPHILPKVFETFVSNKETGVGLGLPLSKRIAEDHGGSLAAYNLPGAGACFLLRLPAQ